MTADEHPRPDTTAEVLSRLRPAFREGGTVTAGNSSGINDGAAAALVVEAGVARSLGLRPMARVVATAVAGVDPAVMGLGPIPATRKALDRAGLTVEDLDLVELNEAFASQSVACIRELGLDPDRVNVDGGAIALGHPLGASGGRLITSLRPRLAHGRAGDTVWPRCASAWARGSPRSWSGSTAKPRVRTCAVRPKPARSARRATAASAAARDARPTCAAAVARRAREPRAAGERRARERPERPGRERRARRTRPAAAVAASTGEPAIETHELRKEFGRDRGPGRD